MKASFRPASNDVSIMQRQNYSISISTQTLQFKTSASQTSISPLGIILFEK